MNNLFKSNRIVPFVLLALLLGIGHNSQAQVPPPAPDSVSPTGQPAPPPPPGGPDRNLRPGPEDRPGRDRSGPRAAVRKALQPVTSLNGTAQRFLANQEMLYDGFMLTSGTDSVRIHFIPSMGQTIMKNIHPGSAVTVRGVEHPAPMGGKELELVSVTAKGVTTEIQPPLETPVPTAPRYAKGAGKITEFGFDAEGRISTVRLDNGKMLQIPPAGFGSLSPAPVTGTSLSYTGTIKPTGPGEVLRDNIELVNVRTITLNGQQYLVGPR